MWRTHSRSPECSATTVVPDVRKRALLSAAERTGLVLVALVAFGFGVYGYATGAPSTTSYLVTIAALGGLIACTRKDPLPDTLALLMPFLAAGHLAGGLVEVGDEVLYNVHPSLGDFTYAQVLQYDHLFHATASGVSAVVVWLFISKQLESPVAAIALSALGGLGIGALNELVEFVATLANQGENVGGYRNTGWDLVANTIGVSVASAGLAINGRLRRPAARRLAA